MEDRRYAHQYGDPSEARNKIGTVTGANRLAAIGFSALFFVFRIRSFKEALERGRTDRAADEAAKAASPG